MNLWEERWKVKIDPGILGPYLERFVEELFTAGYSKLTIGGYVGTGAHFGFWLTHKNIALEKIDEEIIHAFEVHNCECPFVPKRRGVSQHYIRRVRRIVDFLTRQGVVQQTQTAQKTEVHLLREFRHWLSVHRGLSEYTVKRIVRLIDKWCLDFGYDSKNYTSENIRNTVCAYADSKGRGQVKCFTTALRTFIKFLVSQGMSQKELLASIPVIPQWRLSSLPKYLHETDVKKIIASCDTNKPNGVRDRAILLLLSHLALRAGDIVAMRLQDVSWEKGTIKLSGKGRIECHLPLPQEVGDAILAYLESVRPVTSIEQLFLCANAPWRPLAGSGVVSSIVAAAVRRAGIKNPPSLGTNLLRHSAATNMLRSGLELEAVSTILRHRSLDMTAHYAKVDVNMLQEIAQPWPGVLS